MTSGKCQKCQSRTRFPQFRNSVVAFTKEKAQRLVEMLSLFFIPNGRFYPNGRATLMEQVILCAQDDKDLARREGCGVRGFAFARGLAIRCVLFSEESPRLLFRKCL